MMSNIIRACITYETIFVGFSLSIVRSVQVGTLAKSIPRMRVSNRKQIIVVWYMFIVQKRALYYSQYANFRPFELNSAVV